MTGPSVLQLVRNRAGFSWRRTRHRIKVRLVGLDFMELRNAPIELRAVFEFYCFAVWAVLSGLYLYLWL